MSASRADRRRFKREFEKVLKNAIDKCTVCGTDFEHNSKTYGGFALDGRIVSTGECCVGSIDTVMTAGLFLSKNAGDLLFPKVAPNARYDQEEAALAIETMQSRQAELDEVMNAMMRKAGINTYPGQICVADTPWKTDDATWFREHPDRSHRLRSMYPGEAAALPPKIAAAKLPPMHRLEILVRQVEPGKRMRTIFCRNTEIDIPDQDGIILSIFDQVLAAGDEVIDQANEINDLARKMSAGGVSST